ncbi:hypothetical protein fugu_009596 [Takifugu bimaculatus]|uniref:C2H2-type domain-containing protein n=1 Tax=Takifugu bimaculatus TaxID=433685 RepID=A0A4Z2CD32_9TELE|nr:hypothetical protein fugu_009596 [Takifugu bimaculatus]
MTADTHTVSSEKTFSTEPEQRKRAACFLQQKPPEAAEIWKENKPQTFKYIPGLSVVYNDPLRASYITGGHTCENSLTPALVRPTMAAVPPSLRMKAFLPFPLDTTSVVRLLPGFSTMDPVQKAILHHTLGLPPATKRKHASCGVCQMRFNSQSQALAHLKGTKHAKKLKALDAPKSKLKGSGVTEDSTNLEITKSISSSQLTDSPEGAAPRSEPSTGEAEEERPPELPSEPDQEPEAKVATDAETEEEKARRLLYCSLCKVAVNSASQLEAHNSGKRHHKTMLGARTGVGSIKSFPRTGVKSKLAPSTKSSGLQNKTFYCETCDVHVNSDTQLKQHISSRRHKDRAAGKPAKQKYSPYMKTQKGQSKQPIKLTLGKELQCQPLPAQILPAHLACHGGGRRRHERLRRAPHGPRHEPRAKPRPLSDADPVCGAAPARPGARQDLPPTGLILPILTSLTRLGQGGHLHPRTAIVLGSSPRVDPPTFKAKPACCEAQCSQYSRFLCHTGTSDSYSDPTHGPTWYCNNKTDPLNYAGR